MRFRKSVTSAVSASVLALALAGCSANEADDTGSQAGPTPTASSNGVHNAADTEFAQMMIVHHEGAVEMAALVEERASTEQVRELGTRIRQAQGPEIATMTDWLDAWGEPLPGETSHAGMDHGGMDMDGMDQDSAMAALEDASEEQFDEQFLTLMIEHHLGAVDMAQELLDDGLNPDALALAEDIIEAQESEIAEMRQMLEDSAL